MTRPPPTSTLFPYTTLFRSRLSRASVAARSALPRPRRRSRHRSRHRRSRARAGPALGGARLGRHEPRSEEHTSELQSHVNLVCRLLLEKKKQKSLTSAPIV